MAKIRIENSLYDKLKKHASEAKYSSLEEFVTYILEKEIEKYEDTESKEMIENKLRGLGYLE